MSRIDETNPDGGFKSKRGRPRKGENKHLEKLRNIQKANAVLNTGSLPKAYQKLTGCADSTAKLKAGRFFSDPQVLEILEAVLQYNNFNPTNREIIEKVLQMVVANWIQGKEATKDMLKALELLSKLIPDFKNRSESTKAVKTRTPEEIEKQLREDFGIVVNPKQRNVPKE